MILSDENTDQHRAEFLEIVRESLITFDEYEPSVKQAMFDGFLLAKRAVLSKASQQVHGDLITGSNYDAGLWSRANAEAMAKDGNLINPKAMPAPKQEPFKWVLFWTYEFGAPVFNYGLYDTKEKAIESGESGGGGFEVYPVYLGAPPQAAAIPEGSAPSIEQQLEFVTADRDGIRKHRDQLLERINNAPHWVAIEAAHDMPDDDTYVLWDGCDLSVDFTDTEVEYGTTFFSNGTEATHYLAGLNPPLSAAPKPNEIV